ncbi:MAG: alkaline phosphatase family protein [Anaerolineales bacterium]|nr:alkaline phosphatase family protein [Anaerolineales bacterium]
MTEKKNRILIIGLDGATLDLIKPWAQAGYLPHMADLMQRGAYGVLNSVQPVISAAAWTTFMTGTNPGKHGVFDFVYREPDGYRLRPATSRDILQPSLWRLLSEAGRQVGIMNVPMTYPVEVVNGFLVSGLGTPNFKDFTYPLELGPELLAEGYRVNRHMYYPGDDRDGFLADSAELVTVITQAAVKRITEQEWDLFTVVYRDSDDVPHGFWRDMDPSHPQHQPDSPYQEAILQLYQKLDDAVGQLVTAAGPETNIVIVSDHGFGPLYKDVFLNEWLRQKGYLVTKEVASRRALLSKLGLTRSNVSKVLRGLGLGIVERWIKDLLGDRIELLPRVSWPDFSEGIDWARTRAYSFGYQGQIFVNLKGREPEGLVEPGEAYEDLLQELRADLAKMVDPEDGEKVVDHIYRKEELFQGPGSRQAPDLTLVMRDLSYITRLGYELSNQPGQVFGSSPVRENGGHRLEGVIIAAGPALASGGRSQAAAWLGDIAPTVLHVLGEAVPDSMDGQVLHSWLEAELQNRPVQYMTREISSSDPAGQALSALEEQELMERLSDLGYLG